MGQQASEHRGSGTVVGQPGMEVMPEVSELLGHEIHDRHATHVYPRKPVPSFSVTPIDEYPHSYSQKSRFSLSSDRILAFVLGFLCSTILIGAILGGSLGSRLASCQRSFDILEASKTSSSSSTNTTASSPASTTSAGITLEDYKVVDHQDIDLLHNTCTQGEIVNIWGDKYATSCGKDFNNGFPAAEGGIFTDFASLIAYSFEDCLNACSGVNNKAQANGFPTKCRSITFGLDMRNSTQIQYSNCWLKNGTLKDATSGYPNKLAMSAKLMA